MKSRNTIFFLLSLLSLPSLAESQLDKWLAEAIAKNPEIRAASNRWAAARANIGTMGALPDPLAGANVERSNTSLQSFNDIAYSVQQEVPWFGKRDLATKGASAEARAAEMEWRMKSLETGAAVKMAYYDLWQTEQEIGINLRTLSLLDKTEKAATARYENGKASQSDVIKASNETAKLVENQMELSRERETTHAELARLLAREQGASVEELSPLAEPKFRIDTAAVAHDRDQRRIA